VKVTKVVRTSWRIEWEYDGQEFVGDEDGTYFETVRRIRVRHMQGRGNAYRAAAMRLIFARRDRYAKGVIGGKRQGCKLCDAAPVNRYPDDPSACRYHDGDSVEALRNRLARRLMWRDGVKP
jgi:hypothetical protein